MRDIPALPKTKPFQLTGKPPKATRVNIMSITRLQPKTKPVKVKPVPAERPAPSRKIALALRRQMLSSYGVAAIAVILTGLSLSHLAYGIEIVTGSTAAESYAMALGIDLGFLSAEIAILFASTDALRRTSKLCGTPIILGTLALSAAMNAFAFVEHSEGWKIYPAIVLGVAIPALVFALTRMAAPLYIDCDTRG